VISGVLGCWKKVASKEKPDLTCRQRWTGLAGWCAAEMRRLKAVWDCCKVDLAMRYEFEAVVWSGKQSSGG
jgi:hypothetical protein